MCLSIDVLLSLGTDALLTYQVGRSLTWPPFWRCRRCILCLGMLTSFDSLQQLIIEEFMWVSCLASRNSCFRQVTEFCLDVLVCSLLNDTIEIPRSYFITSKENLSRFSEWKLVGVACFGISLLLLNRSKIFFLAAAKFVASKALVEQGQVELVLCTF